MGTQYILDHKTNSFSTNLDVMLFSNSLYMRDEGLIDIGIQATASSALAGMTLNATDSKLYIGGNFSGYKNIDYTGNNATKSSAVKASNNMTVYFSAQTGGLVPTQYGSTGTAKPEDSLIQISAGSSTSTGSGHPTSSSDGYKVDSILSTFDVAGTLTVGGDVSGTLTAASSGSFYGLTADNGERVNNSSTHTVTSAVFRVADFVLNNNFTGTLSSTARLSAVTYTGAVAESNTVGAYGLLASGTSKVNNGYWGGKITTSANGSNFDANWATQSQKSDGGISASASNNSIESIGIKTTGQFTANDFTGTLTTNLSSNTFTAVAKSGKDITSTASNNKLTAAAIYAGAITLNGNFSGILNGNMNANAFSAKGGTASKTNTIIGNELKLYGIHTEGALVSKGYLGGTISLKSKDMDFSTGRVHLGNTWSSLDIVGIRAASIDTTRTGVVNVDGTDCAFTGNSLISTDISISVTGYKVNSIGNVFGTFGGGDYLGGIVVSGKINAEAYSGTITVNVGANTGGYECFGDFFTIGLKATGGFTNNSDKIFDVNGNIYLVNDSVTRATVAYTVELTDAKLYHTVSTSGAINTAQKIYVYTYKYGTEYISTTDGTQFSKLGDAYDAAVILRTNGTGYLDKDNKGVIFDTSIKKFRITDPTSYSYPSPSNRINVVKGTTGTTWQDGNGTAVVVETDEKTGKKTATRNNTTIDVWEIWENTGMKTSDGYDIYTITRSSAYNEATSSYYTFKVFMVSTEEYYNLETYETTNVLIDTGTTENITGGVISLDGAMENYFGASVGIMSGKTALNIRVSGEIHVSGVGDNYAILADDYRFSTGGGASHSETVVSDRVEIATGADIIGDIELNGGTNYVYVDSNARVQGDIVSSDGATNLTITLNNNVLIAQTLKTSTTAILSGAMTGTGTSDIITVNLNDVDTSAGATYILIDGIDTNNYWRNSKINLSYQGKTTYISFGGALGTKTATIAGIGTVDVTLNADNITISNIQISGTAPIATVQNLSSAVDNDNKRITLSWDLIKTGNLIPTDGYYELEYAISSDGGATYQKSIVVRLSKDQFSENKGYYILNDIKDGQTVSWRVRGAVSDGVQTGAWTSASTGSMSAQEHTFSKITGSSLLNGMSSTGGADSAVITLTWDEVMCSYGLKGYNIRYFTSETKLDNQQVEAMWASSTNYYQKWSTANNVVISQLTDKSYFYWQIQAVDTGNETTGWTNGVNFRVAINDVTPPTWKVAEVTSEAHFTFVPGALPTDIVPMHVTFSWDNTATDGDSDDNAGSGLKGYILTFTNTATKVSTTVTVDAAAGGSAKASWSNSVANGNYTWSVVAVDFAGNQSTSKITGTWSGDSKAPTMDESKQTASVNLNVSVDYSKLSTQPTITEDVTFSWEEATDPALSNGDAGSGVAYYVLAYKAVSSSEWLYKTVTSGTTLTVTGLAHTGDYGAYNWYVTAYDYVGNYNTSPTQQTFYGDRLNPNFSNGASVTVTKRDGTGTPIADQKSTNYTSLTFDWSAAHDDGTEFYTSESKTIWKYVLTVTSLANPNTPWKYTMAGNITDYTCTVTLAEIQAVVGTDSSAGYQIGIQAYDATGKTSEILSAKWDTPDITAPTFTAANLSRTFSYSEDMTLMDIDFAWTPAVDTESGVGSYQLKFSGDTNIYTITVDASGNITNHDPEYVVANYTNGTYHVTVSGLNAMATYTWYMIATDNSGNSTEKISGVTIEPDTKPPTFTADYLYAPVLNYNGSTISVTFNWKAAEDESGIRDYKLYYRVSGTTYWVEAATIAGSQTTYTVAAGILDKSTTYEWAMVATDNSPLHNKTDYVQSNYNVVPDITAPDFTDENLQTPVITYVAGTTTQNVTVSWTPAIDDESGVASYTLKYTSAEGKTTTVTLNPEQLTYNAGIYSYNFQTAHSAAYSWTVYATDKAGNSSSPAANGTAWPGDTVAPAFDATGSYNVTVAGTLLTFNWTGATDNVLPSSGVKGYQLYYGTGDFSTATLLVKTDSTNISYQFNASSWNDGTYNWWIKAYDQVGNLSTEQQGTAFTIDTKPPQGSFTSVTSDLSVTYTMIPEPGYEGDPTVPQVREPTYINASFTFTSTHTDISDVAYVIELSSTSSFYQADIVYTVTTDYFTEAGTHTVSLDSNSALYKICQLPTTYWRVKAVDRNGYATGWSKGESLIFRDFSIDPTDTEGRVIYDRTNPTEVTIAAPTQSGSSKNQYNITWSKSTDAFSVKSYQIRVASTSNSANTVTYTVSGDKTSVTTGILSAGSYTVSVLAIDGSNRNSGWVTYADTIDVPKNEKPRTSILDNGFSQILAYDTAGKVGQIMTDGSTSPAWGGIWEFVEDPAMWSIVGAGNFSSNTAKDGVLLLNRYTGTYAVWSDLSRGDYGYVSLGWFGSSYIETIGLGTLGGNSGFDDILVADKNGNFGVMLDGTTYKDIWHESDTQQSSFKLIASGSFGAASGMDDLLLYRASDNSYFMMTNNDPSFNTWNWSSRYIGSLSNDWQCVGVGDFSGDGADDIIMWNQTSGAIFAWENGLASNQRYVGTLDPAKWEIAAIGDYNGDGKEDLLLRNLQVDSATGIGWGGIGYWASADGTKWNDLNAHVETNFAVIA